MSTSEIIGALAFVALVAFAAVLAVAETALTHLGRARAAALVEDGEKRAAALVRVLDQRERVLNPVLFVLLTCHLGAATIVAVLIAYNRWETPGVVAAFVVELIVIFVLAEAVPKTYACSPPTAALFVAPARAGDRSDRAAAVGRPAADRRGQRDHPWQGSGGRAAVSEEELLALAGVAVENARDRRRGAQAHREHDRVRRHRRARGDGAAAGHGDGVVGFQGRRRDGDRDPQRLQPVAGLRRRHRRHRRHRARQGPHARRARRQGGSPRHRLPASGHLRAGDEEGAAVAARDAGPAVPHGDRHRRVRRHRRAGHARGPHRRARRRDRRRVRRRGPSARAAAVRRVAGQRAAEHRRPQRAARGAPAGRRLGLGRRPAHRPARPRAGRRARRPTSTATA